MENAKVYLYAGGVLNAAGGLDGPPIFESPPPIGPEYSPSRVRETKSPTFWHFSGFFSVFFLTLFEILTLLTLRVEWCCLYHDNTDNVNEGRSLRCALCFRLFRSEIVLEYIFLSASILRVLWQVFIFHRVFWPLLSFVWKIV